MIGNTPENLVSLTQQLRGLERKVALIIAASRSDLDVTQGELAMRIGWSRNVVANIEKMRRAVTVAEFIVIARALRLDPGVLLRRVQQW